MPQVPDVLADPVGVVADLVAGIELSLGRASIEDVVARVAGGRAKRRRLARALLQRPLILTDGRSPAPRVAGDLLIALRRAGAVIISPPVCAGCGRQLRTLQRRGEDWYWGPAAPCLSRAQAAGSTDRSASATGRDGRIAWPASAGAVIRTRPRSWPGSSP
jgi:hypothetical protein